ncbi:hypothetical protein E4U53_001825 [Claviceps sorghi]|nr:hypothetical protein E4U53_001825 [Claviceps sorghi]
MSGERTADEAPTRSSSTSTQEFGSERWSSSVSSTSVSHSSTSGSEPPTLVPESSVKRNSKTLSSSAQDSIAPGVQKPTCSVSGAQESAAVLHSSYDAPRTDQSCNAASSPGSSEVGRRQHVFEFVATRDEGEQSAGPPFPAREEIMKPGSNVYVHRGQYGAEQVDKAIVVGLMTPTPTPTPPPPRCKCQPLSPTKNNVLVAESATINGKSPKRRCLLSQFRRGSEPICKRGTLATPPSESVPLQSPVQPEKRRQRQSVAGSTVHMHMPTSTECAAFNPDPWGKTGRIMSSAAELVGVGLPHLVSALSATEKNGACQPGPGRKELPYTLAVVIPDGKLFEDEMEWLQLLSF